MIKVVAPSNYAVDEIAYRLSAANGHDTKYNLLRIGVPHMIHSKNIKFTLDYLTDKQLWIDAKSGQSPYSTDLLQLETEAKTLAVMKTNNVNAIQAAITVREISYFFLRN